MQFFLVLLHKRMIVKRYLENVCTNIKKPRTQPNRKLDDNYLQFGFVVNMVWKVIFRYFNECVLSRFQIKPRSRRYLASPVIEAPGNRKQTC